MTPRLRTLKEPPLLNLPDTVSDRLKLTSRDRENIEKALKNMRKFEMGYEMALMYSRLAEVEPSIKPRGGDEAYIRASLEGARKSSDGHCLLNLHYTMPRLGMGAEITGADREVINAKFSEWSKDFVHLAMMHYQMRAIGIHQPLTGEHREGIRNALQTMRKSMDGLQLAHIHYYMHELGFGEPVMPEDREVMYERLKSHRKADDAAYTVLMLYFIRKLEKYQPVEKTSQMPPLKRFGGGG